MQLLLYGSADLNIEISKKVFDAVHMFIEETGRLYFVIFTCESYCLVIVTFGIIKHSILGSVGVHMCVCD